MSSIDLAQRDREAAEDRQEAAANNLRGYFLIRGIFVQSPTAGADRSGTLATFVTKRQHRALLLYLMLLNVWPWLQREKDPLEAHVWMNLLHSRLTLGDSLVWSESTLSRTWKYLATVGLIEKKRGRKGRLKVRPRLEDASGPYTTPAGGKAWNEVYFTLPERFWSEEDFARLNLPGLAVLLVLAKETNKKPEFRVTQEQIAEWYGISRSTAAKGLGELRGLGILKERTERIPAKLSKVRTTTETYFSLSGDYSTASRKKARNKAESKRRRVVTPVGSGAVPSFEDIGDSDG